MSLPPLHHVSERADIARFEPRPVAVPSPRPPGMDWLNGPLVWAIDDWHQPLYLFPRDCPRILLWPTAATTEADRARHWPDEPVRMLAYVEQGWLDRIARAVIHRYRLPAATFRALGDAGMWVSRDAVDPETVEMLDDLPPRQRHPLAQCGHRLALSRASERKRAGFRQELEPCQN